MAKVYGRMAAFLLSPALLIVWGWAIDAVFVAARSHSLPEFIWWIIVVGLAASVFFLLSFLAYRMPIFVADLLCCQGPSLLPSFLPVGFFVVLFLALLIGQSIATSSFRAECPQSIQDSASGKNYVVPLLSISQERNGISFVDDSTGGSSAAFGRIRLANYRRSGDKFLECVRDRFKQ